MLDGRPARSSHPVQRFPFALSGPGNPSLPTTATGRKPEQRP